MAGQTISCASSEYSPYTTIYYAMVDASGNPYTRIVISGLHDTGWSYGTYIEDRTANGLMYPNMTITFGGLLGQIFNFGNTTVNSQHITCVAYWS